MSYVTDLWRLFASAFPGILALELGRYAIVAGLVSVIIWSFWRAGLEARKIQTRSATKADYVRELLTSLRTALIFAITGFGMYLASRMGWLTVYSGFSEQGFIYFSVSLVAMVLAHDAYFYWTHRMMHHPRLFRLFHRTHHRSHTPTPWTAYAFDIPEAIVMVAFVPVWVALVPMHELAIYLFMTWQIVRNVLGHAGVELSPASGKPSRLFGWLNTTTHHDLHHQNARWNYGLYFSWWDRWMGTEHPDYQARVAQAVAGRGAQNKGANAVAKIAAVLLIVAVGVAASPLVARAQADAQSIEGAWATRGFGSVVRFQSCAGAPETMCGRIVWLWEPNGSDGRPRVDSRNPDRAKRSRSLIGVEIVSGLRQSQPGVWSDGQLYNPDDGRTYTGTIRLVDGTLELRGCALSVFCDTQTWRRPDDILQAVRGL